jgi:dimethylhistidine N-methyltransferase
MKQFAAEIPIAPTALNFRVVTPYAEQSGGTFLRDVVAGLAARPKTLPEKYFYDRRGSELFDAICELPEYYPTRIEIALLRAHSAEIAQLTGAQAHLIEFGSGASTKVRILLDALAAPASYVGVDISREYLLHATQALAFDYPDVSVLAVCADFTRPFRVPALPGRGVRLGFFPGSTIGNLNHDDAEAFLRHAAVALRPGGGLLIGVDLKKETEILHAAYNDAKGITAAFNLNLLTRINRELDATFELRHFAHEAFYEPEAGRIEMHLRSLIDQSVRVGKDVFHFAENETIHTENSHKYTVGEFQALARRAGLRPLRAWSDPNRLFSLHYLSVPR